MRGNTKSCRVCLTEILKSIILLAIIGDSVKDADVVWMVFFKGLLMSVAKLRLTGDHLESEASSSDSSILCITDADPQATLLHFYMYIVLRVICVRYKQTLLRSPEQQNLFCNRSYQAVRQLRRDWQGPPGRATFIHSQSCLSQN